jgi:hypothetical protein
VAGAGGVLVASPDDARAGPAEGRPGMPRGRVTPGRRNATRAPACKIVGSPPPRRGASPGQRGMRDQDRGDDGEQDQAPARADDSGDDNADDNRAPAAHCEAESRRISKAEEQGCVLLGGQVGSRLGHHAGAGLQPRDRSSDRNEQHRATLEHHPANAACPRRAVRSDTCMHLLIAGSPPCVRSAMATVIMAAGDCLPTSLRSTPPF